MDILDDMGVSKLSANVLLKVNYSFNIIYMIIYFKIRVLEHQTGENKMGIITVG